MRAIGWGADEYDNLARIVPQLLPLLLASSSQPAPAANPTGWHLTSLPDGRALAIHVASGTAYLLTLDQEQPQGYRVTKAPTMRRWGPRE